jgi:DNA gyrase/topoisomerase IV subunit B
MTTYNDESIINLSGLEHIRLRPFGYISDTHVDGLFHILRELIDNAIDELTILNSQEAVLNIMLFHDKINASYRVAVMDNGRGIPVNKLIDVFANTMTSGKFNTNNYTYSAGSFGVGATVSVALSKWFRAITLNQEIIGDATISHDSIPEQPITCLNEYNTTGTLVFLEPDETIFTGIAEFAENHSIITEYLAKLSLFSNYRTRFFVFDQVLPDNVKTGSTKEVIDYIRSLCNTEPIFDSLTFDKEKYVNNYFNVSRAWDIDYSFRGQSSNGDLKIQGTFLINTAINQSNQKTRLTFINNIFFDDNASIHINLFFNFIKSKLNLFIEDKAIKKFFMETYRLPMWLILDIKYSAAQFSGFTKTSFKDNSFIQPYQSLLNTIFDNEIMGNLFLILENHIKLQYDKFSNADFKLSTTMKGLLAKLNRPMKFKNCSTTNREIAELFLVEGDSANSDQDRDSSFQAFYTLGGKPFNGLTVPTKINEAIENIKKNATFQDIIRILNITPGSNDLSRLNFNKVFIMADADTHGYHIQNIVIGNLYLLCPELINSGHLHIVIPPLYSLNTKNNKPIYIKDAEELNNVLAYHVYYRMLDIEIESNKSSHVLSQEEFVYFCDMVIRIGDELKRLSVEYTIPAILLEHLALMTNHLNLKGFNVDVLAKLLGCDVRYVESGNILIISIGSDDIVVPLNQITDLIYQRILPLYREFYYGKTRIYATTKRSMAMNRSPMSIIQLCEIFDQINSNMFTIKRFKGLGSMPSKDKAVNCINPKTRRTYQITNIGDLDVIFDMLGSDSSERKKLITGRF